MATAQTASQAAMSLLKSSPSLRGDTSVNRIGSGNGSSGSGSSSSKSTTPASKPATPTGSGSSSVSPTQKLAQTVTGNGGIVRTSSMFRESGLPAQKSDPAKIAAIQKDTVNNLSQNFGRSGINITPKQTDTLVRTVAGEGIGEKKFGQEAIGNTMENNLKLHPNDPNFVLSRFDANGERYRQTKHASGTPQNDIFKQTKPGTDMYQAGISALMRPLSPFSDFTANADQTLKDSTHYYNPAQVRPYWDTGQASTPVGDHKFLNADSTQQALNSAKNQFPTTNSAPTFAKAGKTPGLGSADLGDVKISPMAYQRPEFGKSSLPELKDISPNSPPNLPPAIPTVNPHFGSLSATAAEALAKKNWTAGQLPGIANDPAVNGQLSQELGNAMWKTREADAMRQAQHKAPLGNFGEVSTSPWADAGFRTAKQAADNVRRGTGVPIDKTFHGRGLASDVSVTRFPGESEQAWGERNAQVDKQIAGNLNPDVGVTWGGNWSKPDFSHFQLGEGANLNAAVKKFGSNVAQAGVRGVNMPAPKTQLASQLPSVNANAPALVQSEPKAAPKVAGKVPVVAAKPTPTPTTPPRYQFPEMMTGSAPDNTFTMPNPEYDPYVDSGPAQFTIVPPLPEAPRTFGEKLQNAARHLPIVRGAEKVYSLFDEAMKNLQTKHGLGTTSGEMTGQGSVDVNQVGNAGSDKQAGKVGKGKHEGMVWDAKLKKWVPATSATPAPTNTVYDKLLYGSTGTPQGWYEQQRAMLQQQMAALGVQF